MMSDQSYDVVVFGATSFVGQLVCRYLLDTYGDELRWAMAGRSASKLAEVQAMLGSQQPVIVADAADEAAMRALCQQTRVVISTVGPYALYGEPLIRACVETGTDYCDLTGEIQWVRQMIDRYEDTAKRTGARIVNCAGFDSIPSDLGVFYLQQEAKKTFGEYCDRVKLRVWRFKGGVSGGTVASLLNAVAEAVADPDVRRQMTNPYTLCPAEYQQGLTQPNVSFAQYDQDFATWVAPFVMASVNTRVVQRSHYLQGSPYSIAFRYDEALCTGPGFAGAARASAMTAGLASVMAAAVPGPTRRLLAKVFPAPGQGPSPEEQRTGFYDIRLLGLTPSGQRLMVKVYGDRDPGYGSTCKMLAETGTCLVFDTPKNEVPGGFWTPASLGGAFLLKRLEQHAGLTFSRLE